MAAPEKPRRLGRGLEALLASRQAEPTAEERSALRTIPLAQIRPNPYQPRQEFRTEDLLELEASLRASGLLQPITVREVVGAAGGAPAGGAPAYELIAGERRLRAAERLGWTEITAVVRPVDDQTLLTLALVENLQRADLSALEEADGYQRLVDEFSLTQQQVAELVGKDRTTVTSTLRLLNLPASVRRLIQDRVLSAGHGRALLALRDEREMADVARDAMDHEWSVRETERRVRALVERPPKLAEAARDARPAEVRRTEDHLRRYFGTDVDIRLKGQAKGEIRIAFYSPEDFDRVLDLLGTRPS